jgi:hypothetical protein
VPNYNLDRLTVPNYNLDRLTVHNYNLDRLTETYNNVGRHAGVLPLSQAASPVLPGFTSVQ